MFRWHTQLKTLLHVLTQGSCWGVCSPEWSYRDTQRTNTETAAEFKSFHQHPVYRYVHLVSQQHVKEAFNKFKKLNVFNFLFVSWSSAAAWCVSFTSAATFLQTFLADYINSHLLLIWLNVHKILYIFTDDTYDCVYYYKDLNTNTEYSKYLLCSTDFELTVQEILQLYFVSLFFLFCVKQNVLLHHQNTKTQCTVLYCSML